MENKNYRHGDFGLSEIAELPTGLKETKTNILMEGKTAFHRFRNGTVYFKDVDAHVFGYIVAKDTVLLHKDHGDDVEGGTVKEARIQNGIYELRRQTEDTNDGLKPVID